MKACEYPCYQERLSSPQNNDYEEEHVNELGKIMYLSHHCVEFGCLDGLTSSSIHYNDRYMLDVMEYIIRFVFYSAHE